MWKSIGGTSISHSKGTIRRVCPEYAFDAPSDIFKSVNGNSIKTPDIPCTCRFYSHPFYPPVSESCATPCTHKNWLQVYPSPKALDIGFKGMSGTLVPTVAEGRSKASQNLATMSAGESQIISMMKGLERRFDRLESRIDSLENRVLTSDDLECYCDASVNGDAF